MQAGVFRLLAFAALLFLAACANLITTQPSSQNIDAALQARELEEVLKAVESPKAYSKKDRLLYYLDAGLLHHYQGDWEASNALLEEAERAFEELQTKSLSRAAGSMLLNDNTLEYAGEDYEDIYINIFKCLNYLQLQDLASAQVETRRIDDKLSHLESKYARMEKELSQDEHYQSELKSSKFHFHSSALARYLSLLGYLAAGDLHAARIDYDNILFAFQSQPELYPFRPPSLVHPQERGSKQYLQVLCFANRGPYKVAQELQVRGGKDHILVSGSDPTMPALQLFWKDMQPDYYFKLSIPKMQNRSPRIGQVVAVSADGKRYPLAKLEDFALTAQKSFATKEAGILLKSLARTVAKGLAMEKAKREAESKTSSLASMLISMTADIGLYLSENADLRLANFFPAAAYIAEIPLPEGEHEIYLEYYAPGGNLLYREKSSVRVQARALNLLQSWCF
ncbi:MAG: hypothetical protein PHC50_08515 [Candidatus Cloacimonetes bacterium]|nr:hypothetical protein [Candidatus Cloacimonadota bacterium]